MTIVCQRDIWHVGFIVDRVEDAMAELTAALGLTWTPIQEIDGHVLQAPDGTRHVLDTRVVFSLELPLSLELIEPSPGTPNVRRGGSAFHHLGYWAEDLHAEEEHLARLGMPCVAYRDDEATGLRRIMFNEGPYGVLLESTEVRTARPGLERFYPPAEGPPTVWHIAFAVDLLEDAMARFGAALGLDWLPIKDVSAPSVLADGTPYVLETRLTFATAGPCALELFERVPGTPNEPAAGTAFHHLGFWTDDLSRERERLEARGWHHHGGPTEPDSRAAFFSSTLGIVLEGCNATIPRPGLERYYG